MTALKCLRNRMTIVALAFVYCVLKYKGRIKIVKVRDHRALLLSSPRRRLSDDGEDRSRRDSEGQPRIAVRIAAIRGDSVALFRAVTTCVTAEIHECRERTFSRKDALG